MLRPRRPEDVSACVDILRRTHSDSGYPVYWPADPTTFLVSHSESASWVASDEGTLVGHVAVHDAAGDPAFGAVEAAIGGVATDFVVIARLIVHPNAQGRGIGRELLDAAVAESRRLNKHPILDVVKRSEGAIAFYESLGWSRVGSVEIELQARPNLATWIYAAPGLPVYYGS